MQPSTTTKKKPSIIKLGYWPIRGRAQISRLLMAYTSTQWQDILYKQPTKWFQKDKFSLGLQFPNLPYLIDEQNDIKLTESSAIQRYIIEKSGDLSLLGKTLQDRAKVNMLLGVLNDIRTAYSTLLMDKKYQVRLAKVYQQIMSKLEMLEKFIGEKQFALGYVTLVDFYIAEISYYIKSIYQEHYGKYSCLQRVRERVNSLEGVKKYYEGGKTIKWPFVTPSLAVIQVKCDD